MKLPVTDLTGNLVFTRNGTIWATWRLQALSYGYKPVKEKFRIKRLHEELLQAFRGEVLLSGITASLDPAAVAEQMIMGVDLENCPEWAAEVAATLDLLEETPPGTRTFWLSVPLKASGAKDWSLRQWQVLKALISETAGLPRMAPDHQVVSEAVEMVKRVQAAIPSSFNARPATPAEHVWLALHHQQRGLNLDSMVPTNDPVSEVGLEDAFGHRGYPEPYLEPGGIDEGAKKIAPLFRRRWLKTVADDTPSFQIVQAITSMPAGGFAFPGGEWMQQADEMPFNVDWVWRMSIESAARAKLKNKKAEARYRNQVNERTDEQRLTGSSSELEDTAKNIASFQGELGRSASEVKASTAFLFVVAAGTSKQAQENAALLRDTYKGMDVRLEQFMPAQQEELWWQLQIGTPTTPLTRRLMHDTTSWHLAGAVPLTNNALGGRTGMLWGLNISLGVPSPVLIDLEAQMLGDHSASIGIAGELGAGKTYTTKRIGGDTIDRGGRIVVLDRSRTREWAVYGESISDCISLDFGNITHSLDPLRMFGPVAGAPYVESLAAQLLNIQLTDDDGIALAETLRPEYLGEHGLDSMQLLMEHLLEQEKSDPAAFQLGKKMRAFHGRKMGKVLFDGSLPAMPLDAQGLVFCTHDLVLPSQLEVNSEHLERKLGIEKIFGRALYALMARIGQEIALSNDADLAGLIVPEAHHLSNSLQGQEIATTMIKEGRKSKGFILMDTHDPDELGPSAALIPTRLVMRQTDRDLARKCLKWLDLDPNDEELTNMVMNFSPLDENSNVVPGREGEGLLRDPFKAAGKVKITPPARANRQVTISSTPSIKAA